MYRKYSGSTKCSRNERLAQLNEQENVIEKKKKEILAKIEAKKKKETEEALRKLQSTNAHTNDYHVSKNNSCRRKIDREDKEIKPQAPRNAFSNDGSFLDQFKKLSRSGLGSTSASSSVKTTQKEREESSRTRRAYDEREENTRWRRDSNNHMRDRKSSDDHSSYRNQRDFNIQSQLPKLRVDHSVSEKIPGGGTNLKYGENNKVNSLYSASLPGSLTKPTDRERKWHEEKSFESNNNGDHAADIEKSKSVKKKFWDSDKTHSQCHNSESYSYKNSSFGADVSTRISPAFTHEAGNSVTSENYHSSKTVTHGEETAGLPTTVFANEAKKLLLEENNHYATVPSYLNPDKSQDIPSLSRTNENSDIRGYNSDRKGKRRNSDWDSSDSDSNSKDSSRSDSKTSQNINQLLKDKIGDGYQADWEDGPSCGKTTDQRQKRFSARNNTMDSSHKSKETLDESKDEHAEAGDVLTSGETRKRRKKSRWGDEVVPASGSDGGANSGPQLPLIISPVICAPTGKTPMLSKLTRSDPGLLQYAKQTFGSTNLSEEDWKKAEDHYKINLLYQDMVKKRAEIEKLEKAGKFKYEYDSDEDVEGGTWEHKLRQQEMLATQLWAEELTRQAAGKHHIGDFLPPEELERFMERYNAVKQGRNPDLSDYKEFKLKEDNVGYRLLQKMGWNEGQGLGQDGSGITNPVNKASTRTENQGLGVERPDGLEAGDDEYDAYRKRMMLAYRFRPNPLNNPRRPYY